MAFPRLATAEQVQAWVELAELSQDPDFRAGMRGMAEGHMAERTKDGTTRLGRDVAAVVRDQVAPALADGTDPASPRADPVIAAITAHYAYVTAGPNDVELRRRLLSWLETANDPRRDRYFQLVAVINGWTAPHGLTPAFDWTIQALRARL